MLAPPRPKSIGESQKVILIDLIENCDHSVLNNFVLQRRDSQSELHFITACLRDVLRSLIPFIR